MTQFAIPLRHQTTYPREGEEFTESNFRRQQVVADFDLSEVGLVLLDIHNWGWGPQPLDPELGLDFELGAEHGIGFGRRMKRITEEKIAPALEAARAADINVYHFNIPQILRHYPQWDGEYTPLPKTSALNRPQTYINRFRDRYQAHERDWSREERRGRLAEAIDLPEPVKPRGDDHCVSDDQLDAFLEARPVNVLFFTGFYANACVRDYFNYATSKYGYLCVLLRDATTGSEYAHTLPTMLRTECAITDMETVGFSTTTQDFIAACHAMGNSPG